MDGIRVFGGIEHLTVLKNPETYGVLPYPLAIPPIFRVREANTKTDEFFEKFQTALIPIFYPSMSPFHLI